MRARIIRSMIETGSAARDFIRLVRGRKQSPVTPVTEDEIPAAAPEVLESFRNQRRQPESEHILNGKRVIKAMDEQMGDFCLPFEFTATARSLGRGITEGSLVVIPGDDRVFEVLRVWYEHQSVRIGDSEDTEVQYVVPWRMIRLVQQKGDSR
jgi:hypothetical protein